MKKCTIIVIIRIVGEPFKGENVCELLEGQVLKGLKG